MKKLLLPLCLIISSIIFGQGSPCPNYQQFGSGTTRTAFLGIAQGQKGVTIGRYADTATANSSGCADYYPGTFIVTDNPLDVLWQRNYNATAWISRAGSGTITSLTFLTDSSIVICFSDGSCDTIPINSFTNVVNNLVQNFVDSSMFTINDSTLIICPVTGSCDTITLGNTNTFNILFDTITNQYFIVTCDTVQNICVGDSCYQQQVCDTISIPRPPTTIYQSGVRRLPGSVIVEHGNDAEGESNMANLLHNTWLYTNFYLYTIQGRPVLSEVMKVEQKQWNTLSPSIISFNAYGKYPPTLLDGNNPVNLYLNYTNPFHGDTIGYMGNRYGYMWMTNSRGRQENFAIDDMNAKQVGVFFDTYSPNNEGVSIFAQQVPSSYNFGNNPMVDSTLLSKRVAIFKTDQDVQLPNYPSTRNDGGTSQALYTDIDGNVKLGPVNGGDIITIINDTTINICSFGTNLCDTIIINNIGNLQTVTILNDSTIEVCGETGCDTLIVSNTTFAQPITADNALRMSTPTNVQLGNPTAPGRPLLHNTYIDAGGFNLTITGTLTPNTAGVLVVNNTNSGGTSASAIRASTVSASASSYGVYGSATSGIGIRGVSNTGNGGSFTSTSGIGLIGISSSSTGAQLVSTSGIGAWVIITPATTSTQAEILRLDRNTSGTPQVGMGGYLSFKMPTTADIIATEAARIAAVWSDPTSLSQTATLDFWTTNTGTEEIKMQIAGNGETRLHKYGVGSFTAGTGTYLIATKADGTLMEYPPGGLPGGGALITADEGLTTSSATNVRLFGPIGSPATLTTDRYLTAGANTLNITANSLAGASAFKITSTSTAATGNLQRGIEVSLSGVNANSTESTYGIYLSNTHAGTASTNYGIYATTSGGTSHNFGVYGVGTTGVRGDGTAYGVRGRTTSAFATGVYGESTTSGAAGWFIGTGSAFGVQTNSIGAVSLASIRETASTNTIETVAQFQRGTTGTPTAGEGGEIVLYLDQADGSSVPSNYLQWKLTDVTTNAITSTLTLQGKQGSSTVDYLVLAGDGSVKLRPITATAASAITPAEGMIVIVSDTNGTFTSIGFWGYSNGAWAKF